MNAIPNPTAYAAHLTGSANLAELARSDDESPRTITDINPSAEFFVGPDQPVLDPFPSLKPKREWRVTKAGLLARISHLEQHSELLAQLNETLRNERRAALQRCERLFAVCLGLATCCVVLIAWP